MIKNKIEIYQSKDRQTEVNVQFENETVWLNQKQMAELFGRDRKTITRHISNIFKENELDKEVVCSFFEHTTQHGAITGKTQINRVKYYNLYVIISVGYRVKSQQGTQFRQWATQRLKDYLVKGYSINEKRLEQRNLEIHNLKTGISILSRAIELETDESNSKMLQLFAKGLSILDDYDHEELDEQGKTTTDAIYPEYDDYLSFTDEMRSDFKSDVFAKPKDDSFRSSVNQIKQCFGGNELYPTLEEKAATLLYLIVKNHSFIDGNKRIGAACFLYFLEKNSMIRNSSNELIISNEALASLTLFIATSKSDEMTTVKKLIISLLNRNKK